MFPRVSFWPGLLLGAVTAFGTRRRWLRPACDEGPDLLLDLVGEAVVVCNASGVVTYANVAAKALFGPEGQGVFALRYPSGQPVPAGQLPLHLACRARAASEGVRYQCLSPEYRTRWLEVSARPRPDGGAVAVFRDITALHEEAAQGEEARRRENVLSALRRRLSLAEDRDALGRGLVEGALALMEGLPGPQARLYLYGQEAKQLTRVASAPDERPKRPRSHRQAQPPVFPFDARSPLLWQVYVARLPFICGDVAASNQFDGSLLGEETSGSACAVPLIAGGVTLGHLSLTCQSAEAFAGAEWGNALEQAAALAALAMAGVKQAKQAARLAGQTEALREIAQAMADRQDIDALADLATGQVGRVLEAEVCLLALSGSAGGPLRLVGRSYRDALLFPERYAPDNPALPAPIVQEAAQTGKTLRRLGLLNPNFEAGPWRAFAGQSGRHSLLAAPLRAGWGAMALYRSGAADFTPEQVQFVETAAALLSLALPSATPPAAWTDS